MPKKVVDVEYRVKDDAATKKKIGGIRGAFGGLFDKIKSLLSPTRLLVAGILAVGVAVVKTVSALASLQTKMVNVGNLFGASRDQVNKLTDDLLRLGTETPQKVEDLADALFDVVSAGVPAAESIEFLGVAANLATSGVTSTTIAVDGLTSAMNAYSIEFSRAEEVSDKFFAAQQIGKTTIAELAQNIGKVAPLAANTGVSLDTLLGSLAAMTKQGVKTDRAATGLRSTISDLIKPTEEASKVAAALGIDFDANTLAQEGLLPVLKNVIKQTGGSTKALAKLFPNVRSLNTVLALSKDNFKDLELAMKAQENSAGLTQKANEELMNTFNAQWQIVKNNTLELGKLLLGWLIPALTTTLKAFNKLFDGIRWGFDQIMKLQKIVNKAAMDGWETSVGVHKEATDKITDEEKKAQDDRLKLLQDAAKKKAEIKLKELEDAKKKADAEKTLREKFIEGATQDQKNFTDALAQNEEDKAKAVGQVLRDRLNAEIDAWAALESAKALASAPLSFGFTLFALAPIAAAALAGKVAVNSLLSFHDGGVFRAPTPGGEGPAMLKDGEHIFTPTQTRNIFNQANQSVTDIEPVGNNSSESQSVIILDADGRTTIAKGVYQKTTDMLRTGELQARR